MTVLALSPSLPSMAEGGSAMIWYAHNLTTQQASDPRKKKHSEAAIEIAQSARERIMPLANSER